MHEPLKNITYLGKKLFFNFLGADFLTSKGGQRHEKQPLLGPQAYSIMIVIITLISIFTLILHDFP